MFGTKVSCVDSISVWSSKRCVTNASTSWTSWACTHMEGEGPAPARVEKLIWVGAFEVQAQS